MVDVVRRAVSPDPNPAIAALTAQLAALPTAPHIQYATGVTDALGEAVIIWAEQFTTAPVVTLALQTATGQIHAARITANSTSATTVRVLRTPTVSVLGINVLGATVDAAGVTVHATGMATGMAPA